MPGLFILIVVVSAYLFTGGFVMQTSQRALKGRCTKCQKQYSCNTDHDAAAFFIGALFPLALPFFGGRVAAATDARKEAKARRERLASEHRLEQANREKKAIDQERRNLENSIHNLELEHKIGGMA